MLKIKTEKPGLQAAKNRFFGLKKIPGYQVFGFGKNRVGNPRCDVMSIDYWQCIDWLWSQGPYRQCEATAIFAPQDGRWKITVSFDGRRFCVPKFRH